MIKHLLVAVVGLTPALVAPAAPLDAAARKQAESILAATGIRAGLAVHVGCRDGRLTAALRRDGIRVVHGLDANSAHIERAREYLRSLELCGPVSVVCWQAPFLPYIDNVVNLLVADGGTQMPAAEIMRVLAPRGVAYIRNGDTWVKTVKPVPDDIDEWTHHLHDASGNAVARDTVVGLPRHLQWVTGPRHGRSHEFTASTSTLVSTAGRIFCIADEAPVSPVKQAADWQLVARDGFNGLLLWQRPLRPWYSHLATWTGAPLELQRRMVAVADRVYVTLGYFGEVSALDAATGETVRTYPETAGAEEVLWHRGTLLVVARAITEEQRAEFQKLSDLTAAPESPLHIRDTRRPLFQAFRRTERKAQPSVLALEPESGALLWKLESEKLGGIQPRSLRAAGDRVFYQGGKTVCLELKSGQKLWSGPTDRVRVVDEDWVICSNNKTVTALGAQTGQMVWKQNPLLAQVKDAFIIDGSLWLGGFKPYDTGHKKYTGGVWGPHFATQRDLKSGEVQMHIEAECPKHHHRCYQNVATERYMLVGRRGTEFYDLKTGKVYWNSWARGVCRYGVMPCNGLLYKPPHACGCYVTVKLDGFNALAAARPSGTPTAETNQQRLVRGPAFGRIETPQDTPASRADWPTFRGDAARSGCTQHAVPAVLNAKWRLEAGAKLTPATVAGGKVFTACADRHQLLALDAGSGKTVWTFTADARIDSPPTAHKGRVLFGCRDGYVYCLRAADGALAWRFRAARDPRLTAAYGQLESVSPLHGSVLVHNDVLYATAGRSSYLDGGIDLVRLNPETGEMLSCTSLYSPDPDTGQQPEQYGPSAMPGAREDILSADDRNVYLQDLVFDKQGVQQTEPVPHLFALTGYLDDSWTHRSYYLFGDKPSVSTGCSGRSRTLIYGRLLLCDASTIYGYGRKNVHWSNELEDGVYHLFARRRDAKEPEWSRAMPIQVRALVLAGDIIFAAGAPVDAGSGVPDKDAGAEAMLLALSAADGAELGRCPLEARPVFNGMAAAGGQLLLTLEGGRIVCMAGK